LAGAAALNAIPEFLRALREWLELIPVAWTNFYPINRVYDWLHGFLDFENAKRLIAYGLIIILMMILRPDGLLTRDQLRRVRLPFGKTRHA
jgi:ABC-type branched-subunit amino acid transport system permease subunit